MRPKCERLTTFSLIALTIVIFVLFCTQTVVTNDNQLLQLITARLKHKVQIEDEVIQQGEAIIQEAVHNLNLYLYGSARILCAILAMESRKEKYQAVLDTWGRRCHQLFMFVGGKDKNLTKPRVTPLDDNGRANLVELPMKEGFHQTWEKVRRLVTYINEHHFGEFDWFLRADDDTYIVMENLLRFLSQRDPMKKEYYGAEYIIQEKNVTPETFVSTGAGMIISSQNFPLMVQAFQDKQCSHNATHSDDVATAKCLVLRNITVVDSTDSQGRLRFLTSPLKTTVHKVKPWWLKTFSKRKVAGGWDCCADDFIGFHYVKPDEMLLLESLLYHVHPYTNRHDWQPNKYLRKLW